MAEVARSAYDMISGMRPVLQPGVFVFVTTSNPDLIASLSSEALSTFQETEGMSLIVPLELAKQEELDLEHPMRCITLSVYSSLEGVGLTAAVSNALSEASIPCNMVAAFHHDHVFVPSDMCKKAMEVLLELQERATKHS